MDNTGEGFRGLRLPAFALPAGIIDGITHELSKKFSGILTTANLTLEETISLGLAQVASVACVLQRQDLADTLPPPKVPPQLDFVFIPQFQVVFQELIQNVRRTLHQLKQVEEYLEATAKRFRVRVCVYSVAEELRRVVKRTFECERSKFFTIYVFERNAKAALLVPKKYLLASRTEHAGLRLSVFITDCALEPPRVDEALQKSLKAHSELFALTQQFAKPLLQYTLAVLSRVRETNMQAGKSVFINLQEIQSLAKTISGEEFGANGKAMFAELMKVIENLGPENLCNNCGEHAPDVTLRCGHSFCADCVKQKVPERFLNARGELLTPMPCLYRCGGEVTIDDLLRMDARFLESCLRTHEERAQLRLCKSCNCLRSLAAFSTLQCGHFVCTYCLATKHSNSFICPTCRSGAYQLSLSGDTLKGKCVWCSLEFQYKHTLPLTCYVEDDDGIKLVHGELCNQCLFFCMKNKVCGCKRPFSEKELKYLYFNLLVRPNCHDGVIKATEMFYQGSCDHYLCMNCVVARAPEYSCPICNVPFNEESYAKLNPCAYCNQPIGQIPLPCGHHLHQVCVTAVAELYKTENHAVCPACKAYIPPTHMLKHITDPQVSRNFNYLFGYSFLFQCPLGNGEEAMLEVTSTEFSWVQCRCHGKFLCAFCLKLKEEKRIGPEETHSCAFLARRELADKMLSRALNVAQCPYCCYPAEVEEHLQCTECKRFFEGCCCAATEAVQAHGAAWHRPNCTRYAEQAAGSSSCALCRSGPPCPKPKALQRPRLIGPRERFQ